ncbi:MAG TPA: hypothetical protein VHC46_04355, partial [Thermodesulfobacteriota bacterium]|nr:hypothetical protein [Thermodesulfobacteriota bacterium]
MSLKRIVVIVLSLALAGGAVFATLHSLNSRAAEATYKTPEESDPYVRFGMEAYDKIRENYWASTTEEQVADHFQLSLQKALNSPVVPLLATRNRVGTAEMLKTAIDAATSTAAKKQMVVDTLIIALYNLQPVGHGQLLSAVQETEL